ncbi:MAG: hypothetical protein HC882_00245, partial [Acidobacteria bacterium]|nr:hypothetical protein [Acidobacteriota bacterium]
MTAYREGEIGIREQRYAYDGAQRLIEAWMLPQSSDRALGMQSSQRRKVSYGYDIFGNMLTRERTDELFAVPAGYEFDMGSSPMMRNRVASSMGDYDAGGRMTRVPGNAGAMMSLLWDAEDRLRVTYGSPVESGGSPSAWSLYDASGYRVVRAEEGARSGIPKLSIRDGAGAVLSEYRVDSASGALVWERDLIRAFGQVIAEREPSDTVPTLSVTHAAASGGTFGFSIGNHVTGSTYAADITTRSGYHHAVFGIEPDAQGH